MPAMGQKPKPKTSGKPSNTYLASLKAVKMHETKAVLPLELMAHIFDYLPVPDLIRCSRTSKRMHEMVYDDTRWVQKLKMMGLWNEAEARQRIEDSMRARLEAQGAQNIAKPSTSGSQPKETLFDVTREGDSAIAVRDRPAHNHKNNTIGNVAYPLNLSHGRTPSESASIVSQGALGVLNNVKSIRGKARIEFGKIYGALSVFYEDIAAKGSLKKTKVLQTYEDPEDQARMLSNLRIFAQCDAIPGCDVRKSNLNTTIAAFEQVALQEFDSAYNASDFEGRMRRCASILTIMNGGAAAVDLFIQKSPLLERKDRFGHPLACLEGSSARNVNLAPSRSFFHAISRCLDEQVDIIHRVFPQSVDVMTPLLRKVEKEIISEYVTMLVEEAHRRNVEAYIKIVPAVFEQGLLFAQSLYPPQGFRNDFTSTATKVITECFEPHVHLYLREELDYLKRQTISEVETWEQNQSAQEASTESFFMSNVSRQAAKRDFLTSFKKVVMMPVNILPGVKGSSVDASSGSGTLTAASNPDGTTERPTTPRLEAPRTELAAKAAIMSSRLEGIGSLFSIEVALNLVHTAKSSIERAALFVQMGSIHGEDARRKCQAIFIHLLEVLGQRHVKSGFDKAVTHLSEYNARDVVNHASSGLRPLVTFLELVNVGDLIQQMIDVFFGQQLVANKLTDRDDYLDPAVKAKKKFEQILDERVAAGLNKGIDVLMDEVDFLCATTQTPGDFRPGTWSEKQQSATVMDIGPTKTAREVVELVSSHTDMLTGSTDKNMLDVFIQEVGVRLFAALCKHLKRQRISTDGAIVLISDTNHYFAYIQTLKNKELLQYFAALRELSQIFLVDGSDAKELATIIADGERYHGVLRVEEVLEFAGRRADWYQIKYNVEKAMYGIGCSIM